MVASRLIHPRRKRGSVCCGAKCCQLAPNRPAGMSALWSLLGSKRTCLGHGGIDAFDPSETLVVRRNDLYPRSIPAPLPKCSFLSLRCLLLSLGLDMKRCAFLGVLGGAVAWPLAARGQTSAKIPRIVLLWHEASTEA